MTIDIQAIRERCEKATSGPWHFDRDCEEVWSRPDGYSGYSVAQTIANIPEDMYESAEFIAYARQDVPTLCDEVERLTTKNTYHSTQLDRARGEIGRLRGELERQRDRCTTCAGTGLTLQRSHNDTSKPYLAEMECPDCKHVRLALAGDTA